MASPHTAPTQSGAEQNQAAPSISLPKGSGAIRGVGEKFAANPFTGTCSMTVPLMTSPGQSGVGPQLSMSYDFGSGKDPFGWGWSPSVPAITRKTDKGLPQYCDARSLTSTSSVAWKTWWRFSVRMAHGSRTTPLPQLHHPPLSPDHREVVRQNRALDRGRER
jgi:hypothetical protein